MRLGLIPLDERPVNTRYPVMIAAIAGAQVSIPPPHLLSTYRHPADSPSLLAWLLDTAPQLDGLIVSCEMLGFGGLIASRISHEPASTILARLDGLREIRRRFPSLPIYGFNIITRVSNANNAIEEPAYWAEYGERLYRLSQLLDQRSKQQEVEAQIAALEAVIPEAARVDFLKRRMRNHTVNLGVLQLLADGVFDLLVLSSDDTSPDGLPSHEKRILEDWATLLALGDRLLMYPGADEVGCVLLARFLNQRAGVTPRVAVQYAPPDAATQVAAYEDVPIRQTVERQLMAAGARLVEHAADLWLAVNAPLARRAEWDSALAEAERTSRWVALSALVDDLTQYQQRLPVAVADVAYPNGADPALIDLLLTHVDLPRLAAYGAWNTAGNTIGTLLAQAFAARQIADTTGEEAQQIFLLHRLLEDWGYQHLVRQEIRQWLREQYQRAEPDALILPETLSRIEQRLNDLIDQLPGFAERYRVVPGSVRLPWQRTFEVDFALERTASTNTP